MSDPIPIFSSTRFTYSKLECDIIREWLKCNQFKAATVFGVLFNSSDYKMSPELFVTIKEHPDLWLELIERISREERGKMTESLDAIGIRHQTDKASQFTRTYAKPHDYLRHMEPFFEPIRECRIKLLEIGVGGGESAKTWLEYFQGGEIFGVDIVKDTNPYNTARSGISHRYTFEHGDQGDQAFWEKFIEDNLSGWDIVIDDGSHYAKDIITTFNWLWPHVVPGGLYCIEDLATSYGGPPFTVTGQRTQMDLIKNMLDEVNLKSSLIERLQMTRELCIIQKSNV